MSRRDFDTYAAFASEFRLKRLQGGFATNSIKLVHSGSKWRGVPYIWIDPPWRIMSGGVELLTSDSYPNPGAPGGRNRERSWLSKASELSDFKRRYFLGVTLRDGYAEFRFSGNLQIRVSVEDYLDPESDYEDWYVVPPSVYRMRGVVA